MRKNILTLGLVATAFVASQSAYASRARNAVLGTADPFNLFSNAQHGSLYVNDAYNMFYSPAKINDNKNFFVMEKSNGETNRLAASNTNDAEGGFVTSVGDFVFGAFLNRTTGIRGNYSNAANFATPLSNNSLVGEMRPIELMFGGDVGVKYGLGYTYGNSGDKTGFNTVTRGLHHNVRAGIEYMGAELFGDVNVASKQKFGSKSALTPNDQEVKNNNFGIGGRYTYGEWVAYAGYRSTKSEAPDTLVANNVNVSSKNTRYAVGVGRNAKLSDSATLNYAVGYHRQVGTTKPKNGNEVKTREVMMPLNVGLESELASWFIARGGMQYNLSHRGTANGIEPNSTSGSLGGTFRFAKVDIDFAMTTAGNIGATSNTDPALTGAAVGFSDSLLSYVSMTYRW